MNTLSLNVIVVTGVAAGIGAEIAVALAKQGAAVIGIDRDDPPPTVAEVLADHVQADVADLERLRDAFDAVGEHHGYVTGLVNNAGVIRATEDPTNVPVEDWDLTMSVNARATFYASCYAALLLESAPDETNISPSIVNIASIAGLDGRTLSPPYAASKAAVINITRSTARSLAPKGIRVNAVCPGIIDTQFNARLGEQFGPSEGLTPRAFVLKRADSVPLDE